MARQDVRRLAIDTAARLFGSDGYHGTGLTRILDESGAPKGSFYFHFPDGKEQLAEEAVAAASAQMEELIFFSIEKASINGSEAVDELAAGLERRLLASNFATGGPITALTLETAHLNERLRLACASAYNQWASLLAEHFQTRGSTVEDSLEIAIVVLSTLEGSLAMAKAQHEPELVTRTARRLAPILP